MKDTLGGQYWGSTAYPSLTTKCSPHKIGGTYLFLRITFVLYVWQQDYHASVHFPQTSAVDKSQQHQDQK